MELLTKLFPYAEEHSARSFERVEFISPELFLSAVTCPICGVQTLRTSAEDDSGRLWFSKIDDSQNEVSENTITRLPACGHSVSFAELKFDCPVGFAKFALTARFSHFDEQIMSDEIQDSDELKALQRLLAVPLKALRVFYALLPSDRLLIEGLISDSEEERLAAANSLDELEPGHFEEHSVAKIFIEDKSSFLEASFRKSKHRSVKAWVLSFLADAEYVSDELVDIISAELRPDSLLLEPLLYYIYRNPKRFQHLKSGIKQFHLHSDSDLRWRAALALKNLELNYLDDIDVVRTLMLDDFYASRLEGLFAFKKILGEASLSEADRMFLSRVIDKDENGSAAFYAKELLSKQ
ncbi:MAG: hypothetical protein K2X27_02225 [Candidatus Obscuribacterales bacterium]|nr:hypothetical protein [Candidatus Obscuribacterales bacterium]